MTREKNTYHHGNLRSELKKAALKILDEEGLEAVSIRKIARYIGVAHSAPANHFKDKKSLFTALVIDIFYDLATSVKQELTMDKISLSQNIHTIASTLLKFGMLYPNRYRLIWRRDYLDNEEPTLNIAMDLIYNELLKVLSENQKTASTSIESQAIALWSLIHGYVTMRLDGNLVANTDEITGIDRQSAIIEVLLNGIMCK